MSSLPFDGLDAVLEQAVAQHLAGERVDIDALAAVHPEHAKEIVQRWRSLEVLRDPLGPMLTMTPVDEIGHLDSPQFRNFEIIREIGRGGMGVVYEARQLNPPRPVAIKVIRTDRFMDGYSRRLFQREIAALARLKHPGIAAIYEAGETQEGQRFFAMELAVGLPLAEYLRQTNPPRHERLQLFCKVCAAINYAHQRGVIHRDIKPANVFIEPDGNPKVLDFGLARTTDRESAETTTLSDSSSIQGTLRYMSPEQALGQIEQIDIRADVYSLGVILYELLTGRLPYDLSSGSIPQAIRTICEASPIRPSSLDRALRGELEAILTKATEKEPARRYQSVAEFAEDVESHLACRSVKAKPAGVIKRITKAIHRRPLATTTGILAFLCAGLGVASVSYWSKERRREREAAFLRLVDEGHTLAIDIQRPGVPPRFVNELEKRRLRAEELFSEAILLHPQDFWCLMQRARLRSNSPGQKSAARNDLLAAESIRPDHFSPRVFLELLNKEVDAVWDFEKDDGIASRYIGATLDDSYFLAMAALIEKRSVVALRHLDSVLAIQPDNYWAIVARCPISRTHEDARRFADMAYVLRPKSVASFQILTFEGDREHSDRFIRRLKDGLALAPNDLLLVHTMSNYYEFFSENTVQNLAEAKRWAELAVTISDDAEEHANLARVLASQSEFESALSQIEQALAKEPASLRWKRQRARILDRMGRIADAASVLEQVLAEAPKDLEASASLARVYEALGKTQAAIALFQAIEREDPTYYYRNTLFQSHAALLEHEGKARVAIQTFRNGLDHIANNTDYPGRMLLLCLANMEERVVGAGAGERVFEQFARKWDASPSFHQEWAYYWGARGRNTEEMRCYYRAIGLCKSRADTCPFRASLSNVLASIGLIDDAVRELRIAIEDCPSNCRHYVALADVQAKAGRKEDAISTCEQGLRVVGENYELLDRLSSLCNEAGDKDNAIKWYRRTVQTALANVRAQGAAPFGVDRVLIHCFDGLCKSGLGRECIEICQDIERETSLPILVRSAAAHSRAMAHRFFEEYELAESAATRAAFSPDRKSYYLDSILLLADIQNERGKFQEANSNYELVSRLSREGPSRAHWLTFFVLTDHREFDRCLKLIDVWRARGCVTSDGIHMDWEPTAMALYGLMRSCVLLGLGQARAADDDFRASIVALRKMSTLDVVDADLLGMIWREAALAGVPSVSAQIVPLIEELLSRRRSAHPQNSKSIASTLQSFGAILLEDGQSERASAVLSEAVAAYEQLPSEAKGLAACLALQAKSCAEMGRCRQGRRLSRRAIQILRSTTPVDKIALSGALVSCAMNLICLDELREADTLLRESLDMRMALLSKEHWLIANTKSVLGECEFRRGRIDSAEPLLVEGFEGMRTSSVAPKRQQVEALKRLVAFLESQNRPDDAKKYRKLMSDPAAKAMSRPPDDPPKDSSEK